MPSRSWGRFDYKASWRAGILDSSLRYAAFGMTDVGVTQRSPPAGKRKPKHSKGVVGMDWVMIGALGTIALLVIAVIGAKQQGGFRVGRVITRIRRWWSRFQQWRLNRTLADERARKYREREPTWDDLSEEEKGKVKFDQLPTKHGVLIDDLSNSWAQNLLVWVVETVVKTTQGRPQQIHINHGGDITGDVGVRLVWFHADRHFKRPIVCVELSFDGRVNVPEQQRLDGWWLEFEDNGVNVEMWVKLLPSRQEITEGMALAFQLEKFKLHIAGTGTYQWRYRKQYLDFEANHVNVQCPLFCGTLGTRKETQ